MLRGALDLLLPRHCPVSGVALRPHEVGPCCEAVMLEYRVIGGDYCVRCGAATGEGMGVVESCRLCENHRAGFGTKEIVAGSMYEGVTEDMVKALKFGGERKIADVFAETLTALLFDRGVAQEVDLVIPVPLHPFREVERGYNQANEIATRLAKRIETPVASRGIERLRRTPRQARLTAYERAKNLDGAFRCRVDVAGKTVLLVDDVMTTGATITGASSALKVANVGRAYAAVAARAHG